MMKLRFKSRSLESLLEQSQTWSLAAPQEQQQWPDNVKRTLERIKTLVGLMPKHEETSALKLANLHGQVCALCCVAFQMLRDSSQEQNRSVDRESTLYDLVKVPLLSSLDACVEIATGWLAKNGRGSANQAAIIHGLFDEALKSVPTVGKDEIYYRRGLFEYRQGDTKSAMFWLNECLQSDSDNLQAAICLENLKSHCVHRWHFIMLNDDRRNLAYKLSIERAIAEAKKSLSNIRVLDIGSGTGLLSTYAATAGATNIYGCECDDIMFEISKKVIETSTFPNKDCIHLVNELSTHMELKSIEKPVDMIITEIFDAAGLGEKCLSTLLDAWTRNLIKPNGTVIPQKLILYGVIIESEQLAKTFFSCPDRLPFNNLKQYIVDESIFKYHTAKLSPLIKNGEAKLISEPFKIVEINFNDPHQIAKLLNPQNENRLRKDIPIISGGRVDVIGVWFELHLFDGIVLTTSPIESSIDPNSSDRDRLINTSCWDQAIYAPSCHSIQCRTYQAGQTFNISCDFHEDMLQIESNCREATHHTNNNKCNEQIMEKVSYEMMRHLNSLESLYQPIADLIRSLPSKINCTPQVIDISYCPIVGTKFNNTTSHSIGIAPNSHDEEENSDSNISEAEKLLSSILPDHRIENEENYLDPILVIVNQIINPGGLLRPASLRRHEKLVKALSVKKRAKDWPWNQIIYIPNRLIVCCQAIQSLQLTRYSRIAKPSDYENQDSSSSYDESFPFGVKGIHMADYINQYETDLYEEIDTRNLDYDVLSEEFEVLSIELGEMYMETQHGAPLTITMNKIGRLDAFLIWYRIPLASTYPILEPQSDNDNRDKTQAYSILDSRNFGPQWNQSAFILRKGLDDSECRIVTTGLRVNIQCSLLDGYLHFKTNF